MFSCALVARLRRNDRCIVEIRQAIGVDKKLELDFARAWGLAGQRNSGICLNARWRLVKWNLSRISYLL
jgi:hypothetical protein